MDVVQQVTPAAARALRQRALLLAAERPPGASGVVDVAGVASWMGALQAQDSASGLWSLGSRLPAWTRGDVVAALEARQALRTWPMRGTVHLVPARDAHWMLAVAGARALARAARRRAELGLSDAQTDRAVDVLGEALAGGGRLTRAQCLDRLTTAGIPTGGQRGYHLLWYAAQRGVTCIAPDVDGEQTFVLLDDWVPDPHRPSRDEALATLARRYVRSHGPVPVQDLAGWTGLTLADCRAAVALAGDDVVPVEVDGRPMLADPAAVADPPTRAAPRYLALPGYDEFLLGFKDRSLVLGPDDLDAVVPGGNGVFRATLVRDGRVAGTWRRGGTRARPTLLAEPLRPLSDRDRDGLGAALGRYARFVGETLPVRWPDGDPR